MATLCGGGGLDLEQHVISVTTCKSCAQGREHWEWGQCYTAKAADARLIAAAPDLLEALKALLHFEIAHVGPGAYEAVIAARAAIAKASPTDGAASNPERSGT